MKKLNRVAVGLVALTGYALACAWAGMLASGDVALASEEFAPLPIPERTYAVLLPVRTLPEETLDAEVLRALEYWNPRVLEETLRPWANAIVEAACDGCSIADDVVRADAIWLASQASVETKFIDEVLSFRCNRAGYRMCDHGHAVGPWQMHDNRMLGAAPLVQARRAIEWMRRRPQAWTTWKAARAQADAWLQSR